MLSYIETGLLTNAHDLDKTHAIIWFGPLPVYYVGEPELVKKIFTSTNFLNRMHFYEIFTKLFGLGILSSNSMYILINIISDFIIEMRIT